MKAFSAAVVCLAVTFSKAQTPITKVIQLLSDLEAKVIKEGEAAHKTFVEYSEWCEDRSKNLGFEIKTGTAQVEDLKAAIDKATSTTAELTAKIDDTISAISTNEADLKAATEIRATEEKDFVAEQTELHDVISALERAIGILEREAKKGSPSMLQVKKAKSAAQAISIMLEASMLGTADAAKLTALVQNSQQSESSDEDFGAPAAAVYESHSSDIIEVLENLLDKAKDQLDSTTKKEVNSKHNFEMLEQSLKDEIKFGGEELSKAKKDLAATAEAKAAATGDLEVASKTLAADQETKSTLKSDCMSKAQDYEAAAKSRDEELKALAEAKKVITESATGAGDLTYSLEQVSFVQTHQFGSSTSHIQSSADLANFEAVRLVRNLARKEHDDALMQLARRMAVAIRYSNAAGADPFAKVKGLIRDMLDKLEKDSQADASHKAYCDKEMGETAEKKVNKEASIDKLTTEIDSKSARSAKLKEEVASLQKALADLASAHAEMTKIRSAEKAEFAKNEPEMKQGLAAVQTALKVLREYYASEGKAHEAAEGAGASVVGLLEVVESDFSKTLAEMTATETAAQADFDKETRAMKIETATKEQDVKYKTKEAQDLDAAVAEATSDRESVQTELDAILAYKGQLIKQCVAKAETYDERKARREAEIAGLKEALSILNGESVLLQRTSVSGRQRKLRGELEK